MGKSTGQIDLVKMFKYYLKWCWVIIICAGLGFGYYYRSVNSLPDTYTASGSMYVYNANPNLVNYQYTSSGDLYSAVQLLDTYMVVVKSNKVMEAVTDRLAPDYPDITPGYISASLSMGSVSETGVLRVLSTTMDPQLSADICNAVLDTAPTEILRVVGAGSIEILDYATVPLGPNGKNARREAMKGALLGGAAAAALLLVIFLLNQKVTAAKDLTDNYTVPVLASIRRVKEKSDDPAKFLLNKSTPMEIRENYAKLRMNLLYTMVDKESKTVVVSSCVAGEGKSTIAANLAISCGMSGKRVLLIDGDLRRATQKDIFHYSGKEPGLSDVLIKKYGWDEVLMDSRRDGLDILPAGTLPPNPAELLSSGEMAKLLAEVEGEYDLVVLDMPPINVVSDPLVVASHVAGMLFVTRQNYSSQREIRRALRSAEMVGMDVLGFVFYGEKLKQGSYYYNRKYYGKKGYYAYDAKNRADL